MKYVNYIFVLLLSLFFVCSINSQEAFSQSKLPKEIKLGIRDSAEILGTVETTVNGGKVFGGFCRYFGEELEDRLQNQGLQVKVTNIDIVNEYLGKSAPRYDGIKKGLIHIECGPNSIPNDRNKWDYIKFSDVFYETGIVLLLKDELSNELEDLTQQELENKLRNIKIGVVRNTTTIDKFKALEQLPDKKYSYKSFEKREELLEYLEKDRIQAYASDAPILETLLQKRYRYKGYKIFPQDVYLANISPEKYGIAFARNVQYADELEYAINDVLEQSRVKQYLQDIKAEEFIKEKYEQINKNYNELIEKNEKLTQKNKDLLEQNEKLTQKNKFGVDPSKKQVLYAFCMLFVSALIIMILRSSTLRPKFLERFGIVILDIFRRLF